MACLGKGALAQQEYSAPVITLKHDVLRGQQVAFFGRGLPVRLGAR